MRFWFFVIALSLLPIIPIFSITDLPHTHDGLVHLPRITAYFKALLDGQIPVRWAGDLNYGYGMPLFNFIYPLPYFISSIFLFLGIDLVTAFKLTLSLSFLLSGIFMFCFAKEFFKDNKKAFLVTMFYQFMPFRLVELLVRGSFGEVFTYCFLPTTLWGLVLLSKNYSIRNFLITVLGMALLTLSHNSVSLLFFFICLGFIIILAPVVKNRLKLGIALAIGLCLSSFYWLPALVEHKFTYGDLFMKNIYTYHFTSIQNFFIPNLLNSKELQVGGISVQIGFFHVVAIILSIILLRKQKLQKELKKLFIYCLLLTSIALFFASPMSKILWENISILRQFQFPWRFLSIIVFSSSLLSIAYLSFKFFTHKFTYSLLIFAVVISTIFYWRPQLGIDRINRDYYWNFPLDTTYYGETNVIWSAGSASSYPKSRVQVIGEGEVTNFNKKSNLHKFTINANKDVLIIDNTQYFPGWKVYIDNNQVPIQFQDPNWRGLITFNVSRGVHQVKVAFEETKIRLFADLASLATLLTLLSLGVLKIKKSWAKKK